MVKTIPYDCLLFYGMVKTIPYNGKEKHSLHQRKDGMVRTIPYNGKPVKISKTTRFADGFAYFFIMSYRWRAASNAERTASRMSPELAQSPIMKKFVSGQQWQKLIASSCFGFMPTAMRTVSAG